MGERSAGHVLNMEEIWNACKQDTQGEMRPKNTHEDGSVNINAKRTVRVSYHPVRSDSSLQEAGEDVRGMMAVV